MLSSNLISWTLTLDWKYTIQRQNALRNLSTKRIPPAHRSRSRRYPDQKEGPCDAMAASEYLLTTNHLWRFLIMKDINQSNSVQESPWRHSTSRWTSKQWPVRSFNSPCLQFSPSVLRPGQRRWRNMPVSFLEALGQNYKRMPLVLPLESTTSRISWRVLLRERLGWLSLACRWRRSSRNDRFSRIRVKSAVSSGTFNREANF